MNLYAGFYTVYLAMSISTGIFVGQAIGNGNLHKARRYANVSQLTLVGLSIILMVFLLFMRDNILSLFTSDAEITLLAVECLGLFCLAMIPDALIFA